MKTTSLGWRLGSAAGILALCAFGAVAGDLTTDYLTVNRDTVLWGDLTVKSPGQGAAPADGLVLYYSFGADVSPVPDESGSGNAGTVFGAAWGTNGVTGGAYNFNGSSDYISAGPPDGSLAIGGNQLSISAWIKKSTQDIPCWILGKMGPATGSYGLYVQAPHGASANKVVMAMDVGGGWSSGGGEADVTVPNDGQWHHVVAVYDGASVVCYVDSVASTPIPASGDIVSKAYSVKLGWEDGWNSQRLNGLMDEVRVYNRGLTAAEVQGLYLLDAHLTAGTARFETGVTFIKPLGDLSMGVYTNQP